MAFFRQWFLILSALLLGGGQIIAAPTREERAYASAVAAFQDKFYDRAEAALTQFLQTYRRSTNAPTAVLLLAQSEFYLGNHAAAIAQLTASNNLARAQTAKLTDLYIYWTGEARFAAGDLPGAAETFISLLEKFPASPLGLRATVEAAAAFQKLGRWTQLDKLLENPDGLFQHTARLDPASEIVANGRLLQAESKCAQRDFTGAIAVLKLLNPATLTPEQDWKRTDQLFHASLGLDDLEAALAATTNLLQIARRGQGIIWTTNLARSVASHAEVLEKQGELTNAIAAWQENLTNGAPAQAQQQAILKMAALAAAQNDLTNAAAGLETFLARFPGSPEAEFARLNLGELQLKDFIAQPAATNLLAAAADKFDRLTNSPLAGKAYLDRGWCRWLAGKYPESLADFESASQRLPLSEDLAVARFKMGDAHFALANFAAALTNYQAVLANFSALPDVAAELGDLALYQMMRARLALHDPADMDGMMSQLLAKFFTNAPAASSQLLEQFFKSTPADSSLLLADVGSPAKAREVFSGFERERTDSPLLPQVAFAVSRTFEREQNWPAAVTNYANWLKMYPTNQLRSQVEYARDWAVFQTGDEAGAAALFAGFIGQFPTNALAPLAHWWVADHYFRLGGTNLNEAERNYQVIFLDFPTNELAAPAQIMAGRAAMNRFDYSGAIKNYFFPLLDDTNCPDELKVQARFAYCDALRKMSLTDTNNASLQQATNLLAQICPLAATNEAGALAWSELGDCDLQLGALDAATNAYAQVLNSPAAGVALRNRAQFGLGMVLEKKAEGLAGEDQKALLNQALNQYLNVVDLKREDTWTKKAALRALQLIGTVGSGDRNLFLDRLEVLFPQLKEGLEKKRAALTN